MLHYILSSSIPNFNGYKYPCSSLHPRPARGARHAPVLVQHQDAAGERRVDARHLAGGSAMRIVYETIPGWWFEPLWKILVNWDDYSQ